MVRIRSWTLAIAAVLAVTVAGCSGDAKGSGPQMTDSQMTDSGLPPTATVVYQFHDSSVPPQYHRSYTLNFDRNQVRIVVDSYGDVLADRTAPMTEAAWTTVSNNFASIRNITVRQPQQGCVGGTGFGLKVDDGGATTFSLNASVCGGANSDASRRVRDWVQPVRTLLPSLDELAP